MAEPWMNGIGGGGYLVGSLPGADPFVVEYPMIAPRGATPEMFPLSGAPADVSLFGWPGVVGAANIVGHRAVGAPGTVAGLALAAERFGTMSLAALMAPAIGLAEDGVPVTWHTTLTVARDLGTLQRYPATAAVFLDAVGNPPVTIDQARPTLLRQPDLARTLAQIADQGPRAFYEGETGEAIAAHLAENGAPFSAADLRDYRATVTTPLAIDYRGHQVLLPAGATGGTTVGQVLMMLDGVDVAALGHNTPEALDVLARVLRAAFADRFAWLADPDHVEVPLAALLSADYAADRLGESMTGVRSGRVSPPRAGDAGRLGVSHGLAASVPEYVTADSTTHLSVIDGRGGAVSITQTLLALWGSRVVVPGTGILLNNGMMWFDPEPGRPNSVRGGARPLSNMAPLLVTRDGAVVASLGASGGRKIMACNVQLVMNLLDHGLSMQPAIAAPRIDASTPTLHASDRIDVATRDALSAVGHPVEARHESAGGSEFASPVGIHRAPDGALRGGADLFYPAMAIGVQGT
ncbi:MAG: Gamma-glutamyltranspeptidase @ Glutathione hydrolase [uncultured Thermomicrobiales bacterium]|uniref:Gamma-glutamyltranspeptidase @ Glutathione hydrolase n=1 Tax=uncultured Thermomicrobiales bacterium TaxID=1645740 RepID=A0A6J4UFR5_9BACT|nr:MAG: Gamma-glutamyltranspeptidase @ Glutathione hydrolase [uncultured Thermomicrobiales bacterium]